MEIRKAAPGIPNVMSADPKKHGEDGSATEDPDMQLKKKGLKESKTCPGSGVSRSRESRPRAQEADRRRVSLYKGTKTWFAYRVSADWHQS